MSCSHHGDGRQRGQTRPKPAQKTVSSPLRRGHPLPLTSPLCAAWGAQLAKSVTHTPHGWKLRVRVTVGGVSDGDLLQEGSLTATEPPTSSEVAVGDASHNRPGTLADRLSLACQEKCGGGCHGRLARPCSFVPWRLRWCWARAGTPPMAPARAHLHPKTEEPEKIRRHPPTPYPAFERVAILDLGICLGHNEIWMISHRNGPHSAPRFCSSEGEGFSP